jgi:O-antigen/teichoic acid export membrane protein
LRGEGKVLADKRLSGEDATQVSTVAKGGATQIAGVIVNRGLSFVLVAVATRIIGVAGYGLLRQVIQIFNIAGLVAPGGFHWAAVRFIARARALDEHHGVRGTARVAISGALMLSSAIAVGMFVGAPAIAGAFADSAAQTSEIADLLRLGAAYVPLYAVMQILRNCTQAYKTMVPSVVVGNILQPAAFVGLSTLALLLGYSLSGVVTSLVVSAGIAMVVGVWFYRRMLTVDERQAKPKADVRSIIKFAIPQAGASLVHIQSLGLGVIILGVFRDNREVGLFAIALSLQALANVFMTGIYNIWAPVVSDLHARGEIARLGSLFKTVNRWVATFSVPVMTLLILEPKLFLRILSGSAGLDAAPIVVILALGNLFYVTTGPAGQLISMTGRPGLNFLNSAVSAASYIGFGLLIVPKYGAIGMAIVDAIATALLNVGRVVEAWILLRIQPFGRSFAKPLIATLALVTVILGSRLISADDVLIRLAAIAVGGVVYLLVLRGLGLDLEERHVLNRIRSSVLRRKKPIATKV